MLSAVIVIVPAPAARLAPVPKSMALALKVVFFPFAFVSAPVNLTVAPDSTVSGAFTSAAPTSMLPVFALPRCTSPVPELMKSKSDMCTSAAAAPTDIVLPAVLVSTVTAPSALESVPCAPGGSVSASVLTLIVPPAVDTLLSVPKLTAPASSAVAAAPVDLTSAFGSSVNVPLAFRESAPAPFVMPRAPTARLPVTSRLVPPAAVVSPVSAPTVRFVPFLSASPFALPSSFPS